MPFNRPFLILVIIGVAILLMTTNTKPSASQQYGVFFSQGYSEVLGLDWKEVYQAILKDFKVKHLRLPTYWNRVEVNRGKLDFSEVDYMLDLAKTHQARVSLTLGIKQPRWPECHLPDWARKLTVKERQQAVLGYLTQVVNRYKDHPAIWSYQVENEPLFNFGEGCDPIDPQFLKQEVELVRSLDPNKPIIITDTGEWSSWVKAMQLSDILGISIYRSAFNNQFGRYISYPFPVSYYSLKSSLVRQWFAPQNKETVVTELQAEPWFTKPPIETDTPTHLKLFSLKQLQDNINFAKQTNFSQVYLWGVEWWYYMEKQGHPEYWEEFKNLLK